MDTSIQVGWDWTKAANLERWKRPEGAVMELVSFFPDPSKIKVFDLGCGIGRHTVFFSKLGASVSATDISDYAVDNTKKWLLEEHLKAEVRIGKITEIEESNETFDVVIAYRVIHHAIRTDIERAFREVYRILKPRGYFYGTLKSIQEQVPKNATKIDEQTFIWHDPPEKGIPHFYSKNEDLMTFLARFEPIKLLFCEKYHSFNEIDQKKEVWYEFLVQKPGTDRG